MRPRRTAIWKAARRPVRAFSFRREPRRSSTRLRGEDSLRCEQTNTRLGERFREFLTHDIRGEALTPTLSPQADRLRGEEAEALALNPAVPEVVVTLDVHRQVGVVAAPLLVFRQLDLLLGGVIPFAFGDRLLHRR